MEVILRLQCDDVPGGRIERETPTGLVTIATVAREADGLAVHVITARRRRAWSISRVFGHGSNGCDGDDADRLGQGPSRRRTQAGAQRRRSGR
jgi:hypothetical protein